MLLRPATPITHDVATLTVRGDVVAVRFPEAHDKLIALAKSLGYIWQRPTWERDIKPRNGDVRDRAAEMGHRLLLAGFPVEFADETLAQKAIDADYQPEHTRWITRMVGGAYKDWFGIEWGRKEDLYAKAKRLSGARYYKPEVIVPNQHYEQVLDFAAAHDFRLTEAAQALATEARARWESAVLVQPAPKPKAAAKPKQSIPEGIADELKDEPL
jgi:hypothetical protein